MTAPARGHLLDTNILLHWTRAGSPIAAAIEEEFHLKESPFRPAVCEVSLGEIYGFAMKWGDKRRAELEAIERQLVVINIADRAIYRAYAELHTFARERGLAVQRDHNDLWIAAAAKVSGLQLLSTDASAFVPLRGEIDVVVLDARTGRRLP